MGHAGGAPRHVAARRGYAKGLRPRHRGRWRRLPRSRRAGRRPGVDGRDLARRPAARRACRPPPFGVEVRPAPVLRSWRCVRALPGHRHAAGTGSLVRVRGRALGRTYEVVFLGAEGEADDVAAAPLRRKRHVVDVRVPLGAAPGPLLVAHHDGQQSLAERAAAGDRAARRRCRRPAPARRVEVQVAVAARVLRRRAARRGSPTSCTATRRPRVRRRARARAATASRSRAGTPGEVEPETPQQPDLGRHRRRPASQQRRALRVPRLGRQRDRRARGAAPRRRGPPRPIPSQIHVPRPRVPDPRRRTTTASPPRASAAAAATRATTPSPPAGRRSWRRAAAWSSSSSTTAPPATTSSSTASGPASTTRTCTCATPRWSTRATASAPAS